MPDHPLPAETTDTQAGHRLDMDGVRVRYGSHTAVRDVTLSVAPGMLPIRLWGMMETALDVRMAAAFTLLLLMDRAVGLVRRISA